MDSFKLILRVVLSIVAILHNSKATRVSQAHIHLCQGERFDASGCLHPNSVIKIISVTILTNSNITRIQEVSAGAQRGCSAAKQCQRTINTDKDEGLTDEYRYLYQWIAYQCQGKHQCDATEQKLPEWWGMTNTFDDCGDNSQLQYFAGVLIHEECIVNENVSMPSAPPPTQPRQKPTEPLPISPFPVIVDIYQSKLEDNEKIYLAIAIGLSLVALIIILLSIYSCERYKKNKKMRRFRKQQARLGAPQAAQDGDYDDVDYSRAEAWNMNGHNPDALGEYTGVKPDEFLTLDSHSYVYHDLEDSRSLRSAANNNTASIERQQQQQQQQQEDNSSLDQWLPKHYPDQYYDSPAGPEGDDLAAAVTSDYTIPYIDHSREDLSHH